MRFCVTLTPSKGNSEWPEQHFALSRCCCFEGLTFHNMRCPETTAVPGSRRCDWRIPLGPISYVASRPERQGTDESLLHVSLPGAVPVCTPHVCKGAWSLRQVGIFFSRLSWQIGHGRGATGDTGRSPELRPPVPSAAHGPSELPSHQANRYMGLGCRGVFVVK